MNQKEKIAEFIATTYLFGDRSQLRDDTSFLAEGVIDSTGILELVMFLEETYGIKISQEEMLPENLDSINNIDRFIASKVARASLAKAA